MLGEFEVHEAVVLEDRGLLALVGVILQGRARVGMYATLTGGEEAFEARIHGVEFVGEAVGDPEGSRPALTFSYRDAETLHRWQALDWSDRRLRLYWERQG